MSISSNSHESIILSGIELKASEAVDFLKSKGAPRICPSCGTGSWFVSISPGDGKYPFIGTMGGTSEDSRIAAVFFVTCDNCGLIHTHALANLVSWKMFKERNNA